jgi:acyl-CoA synthetase (AMP-forming)/AMP-acid ligase II
MPHPRRPAPAAAGGEVGEIFTRSNGVPADYSYLVPSLLRRWTATSPRVDDLGYVDAGGYLFLADRRVDQIITEIQN